MAAILIPCKEGAMPRENATPRNQFDARSGLAEPATGAGIRAEARKPRLCNRKAV